MDLGITIKNLLYHNSFVIIPEYGAFVAKYKPADINYQTNKISPPAKYIYFNESLKEDDGVLIDYLSNNEGCTRAEAEEEIENFVQLIEKKLAQGEDVEIDDLGYLTVNMANNKKEFIEKKSENLLLESFGLPIVEFTGDKEKVQDKKIKNKKTKKRTPPPKKRVWITLFFTVLVILSLIYLGFEFGLYDSFLKNTPNYSGSDYSTSGPISLGPSDNKTEESKSIESQLEQATDRHKALTPEIEKPYEQVNQDTEQNVTKIYYIIVGSYVTTDQAKKLQSELIYQGYNSEILISGKKVRVSLKRFSDKEIAVAELEKIRKMKGFEQAWLLAD